MRQRRGWRKEIGGGVGCHAGPRVGGQSVHRIRVSWCACLVRLSRPGGARAGPRVCGRGAHPVWVSWCASQVGLSCPGGRQASPRVSSWGAFPNWVSWCACHVRSVSLTGGSPRGPPPVGGAGLPPRAWVHDLKAILALGMGKMHSCARLP